jgi:hypothetical protein
MTNLLASAKGSIIAVQNGKAFALTVAPAEGVTVQKTQGSVIFVSDDITQLYEIQDVVSRLDGSAAEEKARPMREAMAVLEAAGIEADIRVRLPKKSQ